MARIVLIEDSPTYAKLARLLLKGCGHAVLHAGTAADGLRLAREERPDLILMDLQLPDLDGFEAVAQLRSDPSLRAITTIAMTADRVSGEDEREKGRAAGFDAYVEKPINEAAFRALLEPFLGSPPRAAPTDPDAP